jgi:hypothetical protein
MAATPISKVLLFNGVDWVIFELKFAASLTKAKIGWGLLTAPRNKTADILLGEALKTSYLSQFAEGAERDTKELEVQTEIHSNLTLCCIDALPILVSGVSATSPNCGTELWNRLLRKYLPTIGASRVRLTLEIFDACYGFKTMLESGGDTEDYFANIEGAL